MKISTVVFFDIETTGLPYQERNRTKIIELSFVAITRNDIIRYDGTNIPPVNKLTLVFNPQKTIYSSEITGLTTEMVKYFPIFKEKFNTLQTFLEELSKPVCLVAHNGYSFDYKILLAECIDANEKLSDDLLCSDSLPYFKALFKKKILEQDKTLPKSPEITDDEDDWPELNVTPEEFEDIDNLCSSFIDLNCTNDSDYVRKKAKNNAENKKVPLPGSCKLTDIYRKLLGKEPENAHRSESDCLLLLQCAGVCQSTFDASDSFLSWIDDNCKRLNDITPLQRK